MTTTAPETIAWPTAQVMSAPRSKTQPSSGSRPQPSESILEDAVLARLVQQGIRDLARHSSAYAAAMANKPGARLAHHVAVGYVGQLSESGRAALADLYRLTQAALTVEPGLDTNTFVDRVTGRRDPRQDHAC
ncbi:hypothetical protein [Nocardioides astragali]|uniref:DUF222 domain-containing protein n=1 Tax=Nocardioides astragali TaxID=1776736 RepID=A0ABW2N1M8_9ACTN|nr:hypothetical protein [Nocardioides astragali]